MSLADVRSDLERHTLPQLLCLAITIKMLNLRSNVTWVDQTKIKSMKTKQMFWPTVQILFQSYGSVEETPEDHHHH